MADDRRKMHYQASSLCALCHEFLPRPYDTFEAWEYNVIGICDLASTNAPSSIVTIPADLADPETDSLLTLPIPRNNSTELKVEICFSSECPTCDGPYCIGIPRSVRDGTMYFVHRDCWKLINTSETNHTAMSSLYKLARSTCPIFEYGERPERQKGIYADVFRAATLGDTQTDLGRLLGSIARLPAEIRVNILKDCTQNLLSSLFTVLCKSTLLLDLIKPGGSGQSTIDITCSATVDSISGRMVSVRGQRYISQLRFHGAMDLPMRDQHSISVRRSEIKGVKFVVDRFGLRALSILYDDDSTSAWLGDEAGGWKGTILGDMARGFRVLQDDLKYLRIDLIADTRATTAPRDLVMWNRDVHFTSTQSNQILEYIGGYLHEYLNGAPLGPIYPGWRLCNYLPFVDGTGYITGLTMYCNGHSITGMMAHGESSTLVGYREGCPIHLPLRPSERIRSVWVSTPHDPKTFRIEAEPILLVTTNHHRTCIFGPHVPEHYKQFRRYAWTNLSKYPGSDVLGIFYDALLVVCRRITTIGITQAIKPFNSLAAEDRPSIPIAQRMPPIISPLSPNCFLSIGTFSHVQRLKVWREERRCMGMLICHDDDTVEVLGRWDPTQPLMISDIYNCDEGVITSITFFFSGRPSKSSIEDISCGIDHERPAENEHSVVLHVEQLRQPVAWWFMRISDHVEVWNGRHADVVVSSRTCRVMDLT